MNRVQVADAVDLLLRSKVIVIDRIAHAQGGDTTMSVDAGAVTTGRESA